MVLVLVKTMIYVVSNGVKLKGPSDFWHHFSIIPLSILSDVVVENHTIDLLENLIQSNDLSKMMQSYLSWSQAFLMLSWLGMTTNGLEGIIHPWSTLDHNYSAELDGLVELIIQHYKTKTGALHSHLLSNYVPVHKLYMRLANLKNKVY